MRGLQQRGFFNGLLLGMTLSFITGLVGMYLLTILGIMSVSILEVPQVQLLLKWLQQNLGLSIVPFGITLGLYVHSLRLLQQGLHDQRPADEISQLEHLNDVWTSLFFGIGVIWTAIGMRGALLGGLGDLNPQSAVQLGAFSILQRLVDGGILLALSTTIFGAVGGYALRLIKSLTVGTRIKAYYNRLALQQAESVQHVLQSIDDRLGQMATITEKQHQNFRQIGDSRSALGGDA